MSSVNDKLIYLEDTKQLMRETIISKGVEIPPTATFRSYADYIKLIEGPLPPPGFDWGSETEQADSNWIRRLKKYIKTAKTQELKQFVGKVKNIGGVCGSGYFRCIGYNCDRDADNPTDNTLTFQKDRELEDVRFNDWNWRWPDFYWNWGRDRTNPLQKEEEIIREKCQKYNDESFMVPVVKGTCQDSINEAQDGKPVYQREMVFLPSVSEMGITKENSNAISFDEFDYYNTNKIPYQYYSSDLNRQKTVNKLYFPEGSSSGFDLSTKLEQASYWTRTASKNKVLIGQSQGEKLYGYQTEVVSMDGSRSESVLIHSQDDNSIYRYASNSEYYAGFAPAFVI